MEWYQILFLIIFTEIIINMFGAAIYANLYDKLDVFVAMPSDIKDNTDMNWFGCIVCYILLFILFPIVNIGKVIYWLFHI